jgi:hypothetical protein
LGGEADGGVQGVGDLTTVFFRDFNLVARRVADVVSMTWIQVEDRQHPNMLYNAEMSDGKYQFVDQKNSEIILHGKGQYIPAAANTTLLNIFESKEEGKGQQLTERFPLIGWHISGDGFVTPVTASSVWEDENDWYVVLPNGSVFSSQSNNYESEEALLFYLRTRNLNDND